MGLDMKTKKKLSEETAKRYCTAMSLSFFYESAKH